MRLLFAAFVITFFAGAAFAAGCGPNTASLRGPWGAANFTIELAATPAEREKGLMDRSSMPQFSGMLFAYQHPQRARFWMKNTLIPLDMLFFDRTGVVRKIHRNAKPQDLTVINGGRNILFVLEINGGLATTLGITVGSQIKAAVIGSGAAWPCTP